MYSIYVGFCLTAAFLTGCENFSGSPSKVVAILHVHEGTTTTTVAAAVPHAEREEYVPITLRVMIPSL